MTLPNVYHVEHTISTHISETLANTYQHLFDEFGYDLTEELPSSYPQAFSPLKKGQNLILRSVATTVTSLILREVPFESTSLSCQIPLHIENLDIDFKIAQENGRVLNASRTERAIQERRIQFSRLKNLKTLRLALTSGQTQPSNFSVDAVLGNPPLYFDDLLTNIPLSEADLLYAVHRIQSYNDSGKEGPSEVLPKCIFPRLQSLTLVNCPVRNKGLVYLSMMHHQTLKEIALHRVILDMGNER
ncbi:hypothetical protein MMC28_000398 [Mycoblastus sanguinarius]|nr:hypothetical protein [Mycoblastus sanguinarius]